jgi:uncharacterized protein
MNRRDFLSQSAISALALTPIARSRATNSNESRTLFQEARSGQGLTGVDVVDTHAHFIQDDARNLIWPRGLEPLVGDARRCGIGLTIFSASAGYLANCGEMLKAANDSAAAAVARHKDSLRAYLVFQPYLLKTSIEEMKRILEPDTPFVGFGEIHGAIDQYPTDGPNFQPLYEFCNEHRLHVLEHIWGGIWPVARIVEKYPNMTFTIAHMAFWNGASAEDVMAVLKEHPNLSVDMCSSTWPHGYLERFVHGVGAEKILFATDATYLAHGPQIAKVAFANISEDEKHLIFGGNARRIFGSRLLARGRVSSADVSQVLCQVVRAFANQPALFGTTNGYHDMAETLGEK